MSGSFGYEEIYKIALKLYVSHEKLTAKNLHLLNDGCEKRH